MGFFRSLFSSAPKVEESLPSLFVDPSEVVEAKVPRRRGRDKPVWEPQTVPSKAPVVSSEVRAEIARQMRWEPVNGEYSVDLITAFNSRFWEPPFVEGVNASGNQFARFFSADSQMGDPKQGPLVLDRRLYVPLNARPVGRELVACHKVDLLGEQDCQSFLQSVGCGFFWLEAEMGPIPKGKHQGKTTVQFRLNGVFVGWLSLLQAKRHAKHVQPRPAVCIGRVVPGPNKLEVEVLLPEFEGMRRTYVQQTR